MKRKADNNGCEIYGIMYGGKWDKLHDICRRVYSIDGICPCITTCGGVIKKSKSPMWSI